MTQELIHSDNFDTISRQVTVPNASLESVLLWADVIVEDAQCGDRILLSGVHESQDDTVLRVGAALVSRSDSTVGDTFSEVTVPRNSSLVVVGEQFHFNFMNSRANRPGQVYFPKIGSVAICWQKPGRV
jgi:hypothetical protein